MGGHTVHAVGSGTIGMAVVGLLFWFIGQQIGEEAMPPAHIIGPVGITLAMMINRGYSRLIGDPKLEHGDE